MRRPARLLVIGGVVLLALLIAGDAAIGVYTDALWYGSLGYAGVFWTRLAISAVVRVTIALLGAAVVLVNLWLVTRQVGPVHLRRRYGNLEIAEQVPRHYLLTGVVIVSLLAGWWLSGVEFGGDSALAFAAWLERVPWGVKDPLLGRDLAFYVLALPAYYAITDFLLVSVVWAVMLVGLGYVLVGSVRWRENRLYVADPARLHFLLLMAGLILLVGVRYWLGRYALVVDGSGFGGSLGYTDVHARLPMRAVMAVLALVASGSLVYGAVRRAWLPPAIGVGLLIAVAVLGGGAYPAIVQKFQVEPNQLEREAPYIAWNLDYTRRAYGLENMRRRALPYRRGGSVPGWETLQPTLARLPLWDAEPLGKVFNQLQTAYGYYRFPEVDFDRYAAADGITQVAIAPREFNPDGLSPGSRTWRTLRLNPTYVRGMGAVVVPAQQATIQGQPVYWLANVDPVARSAAAPPGVDLQQPSLFIGQSMTDYVLVVPRKNGPFSGKAGVDYPEGVRLSSLPRLLAFAWLFGDKNLVFSGDLTDDTRLLYRRSVRERVRALAPFLVWDTNAYPVLRAGRTYWIADGYTSAGVFPLSRAETVPGTGDVHYLHSAVKAVIDAVTGDITLYAVPGSDPLLATYRRLFPDLIRAWESMPADLRAHIRYPPLYFDTQSRVLRQYHLTTPEAFFGGVDIWELPPESLHDSSERPYESTYSLMSLPGEATPEFLLTTAFIARQRQNMTGLLFARNDGSHYGELALYELPRDQQIPGPGQVQAIIEQNPGISPQLTLWRQSGSNVDLGHLRVVPFDSTILYVQPLFLSAQSTGGGGTGQAIPELSQVIVSDGTAVAMDSTLAGAIDELSGGTSTRPATTVPNAAREVPAAATGTGWPARALQLLDDADRKLRAGDFAGFGASLKQLRDVLNSANRPQR